MKRMLPTLLLAALLLTLSAGFALAQTPEIEEKMKQAEQLREQMANTSDPDEYEQLKKQYEALGAEIESLMSAQKADAQSKQRAISLYNSGNQKLRQRNYSGAVQDFQQSAELNPMEPRTFYSLGIAQQMSGDLNAALESFNKAVQLDSKYVKAYYAKGVILNKMRQFDQAVTTLQKAVQVEEAEADDKSKAFTGLGLAYYYQKNFQQAVNAFQQAVQLDAQNDDAYYNMGKAFAEMKQYQEAADAIQNAVDIDPSAKYLTALAEKLNKVGRYQQAADAAERATQKSSRYAAAWFELGWARQHMEQTDSAIKAYEQALNDRNYRQPAQYQIDILNGKF